MIQQGMMAAFLKDIESFGGKGNLKPVDTLVTTADGKRYTERTDDKGDTVITSDIIEEGLGFCPDLQPDFKVGVAMPRLLVASSDIAYNLAALQKHKVTHILNVAAALPNAFGKEFVYMNVEMYDDEDEVIMNHYPRCQQFIDDALNSNEDNVVLIHCRAGRSRSVSIAVAYLIHKQGVTSDEALATIRTTRPNIDPNKAFIAQLKQLSTTQTSIASES